MLLEDILAGKGKSNTDVFADADAIVTIRRAARSSFQSGHGRPVFTGGSRLGGGHRDILEKEPMSPSHQHSSSGRKLRVLHIEDNDNDALLVQRALKKNGYDVATHCIASEQEFCKAMQNPDFDIILADQSLGGFSGSEALKIAREKCPQVPFLFVSGRLGEIAAIETLKSGATDYVLKDRLERLVPAVQRALREAEERAARKVADEKAARLAWLVESSGDAIIGESIEGIIVDWNKGAEKIYGYTAEEVIGRPISVLSSPEPIYGRLREGESVRDHESIHLCKDGRVINVSLTMSPIGDVHGKIVGISTIARDITNRKREQEQMGRMQAKLAEANTELSRRNEEIQNFYHTLSHELKTPLTSAREFIAIVMDGLAGSVNETQLEYLGIAKESCNQLRVCLNDLLDASRLETGKLSIELKRGNPGALIQRIITMMTPVAKAKKINLASEIAAGLPEVPMDEGRITQVITNLLNNALKYTPENGQITIKAAPIAAEGINYVEVTVTDTGTGIEPQLLPRIFDRLFQIATGDAAKDGGLGLGLYICQELVHLHGGSIRAESQLGKGSTFAFRLPEQTPCKWVNVLVVDDDDAMLEMFAPLLARDGFNVTAVKSGAAALEVIHKQTPDVILMDLVMPEMDGAATLKEVRKEFGSIPVVVYTGFPDSEIMARAMESGPFTLLRKPCPIERLVQTLKQVCKQRETTFLRNPRLRGEGKEESAGVMKAA
jgi:PAS domain S-box-containing protein